MGKFISTPELATILGISRVAVFKKIKKGGIKAEKIGRNFMITRKEADRLAGKALKASDRSSIKRVVRKIIKEYGATLKKLGEE